MEASSSSVINTQGTTLINQSINASNQVIDISNLDAGIYYVLLKSANKRTVKKMFVTK